MQLQTEEATDIPPLRHGHSFLGKSLVDVMIPDVIENCEMTQRSHCFMSVTFMGPRIRRIIIRIFVSSTLTSGKLCVSSQSCLLLTDII